MIPVARTVLLGVPVACLDMDAVVEWVDRAIASGVPQQVATANVNFLALARRDPDFLRLLHDAGLVTADGMPLCWASRVAGVPLPERVAGSDLVPRLCALAARRGYRVFLMGPPISTPEAGARLCARHPGLRIVGIETPPYAPIEAWDNAAYCARIREARTDLLLVGFGAPKQDRWIARHLRDSGASVAIGVGATFDYVAGRVRRAPRAVQAAGLEWAWRLAAEPRRLWRRYLLDAVHVGPPLLAQLLATRLAARRARRAPAGRARVRRIGGRAEAFVVTLSGRLDADRLPAIRRAMAGLPDRPGALVLDLTLARFLAPAVLGELVGLVGRVRRAGGTASLALSPEAERQLSVAGLAGLAPRFGDTTEAVQHLGAPRERRPVAA